MHKAIGRIPRWAQRPGQYNHKIIRAFFLLEKNGQVEIENLKHRCADRQLYPDTFVPRFNGNFASMKTDGGNAHGKVFVEKDGMVMIWEPIKNILLAHKASFIGSK